MKAVFRVRDQTGHTTVCVSVEEVPAKIDEYRSQGYLVAPVSELEYEVIPLAVGG